MKNKIPKYLSLSALILTLASCGDSSGGSGSGGSTGTLQGVAATGAPLASASVFFVDKDGKKGSKVTTSNDGSYSLSISGLTAPFLIKVVSTDGKTLMSSASAEDIESGKKVNVSPLTHVIVSNVVGNGDANKIFDDFANKASLVTGTNLNSQKEKLKQKLSAAGVFTNLSVSDDIDLLNGELNAGTGAGMDKILDALKVDISEETITIAPKADPSNSFNDNVLSDTSDTDMSGYTPTPKTTIERTSTLLTELKTTLSDWNTVIGSLGGDKDAAHQQMRDNIIHPDYIHRGVGGRGDAAWYELCDGLSDSDPDSDGNLSSTDCTNYEGGDLANAELKNINIETIHDPGKDGPKDAGDYIEVSYDWYEDGEYDGKELDRLAWDTSDSKWKWIGNGAKYKVYLDSLAKKDTSIAFNSSGQTQTTNTYKAGLNIYVPNQITGHDILIHGPGIGDGTATDAEKVVWNSDLNIYAFESQLYLDDDGKPTGTPQTWPATSNKRYNYNANFYPIADNKIKEMQLIGKYTVKFVDDADNTSVTNSYEETLAKPVVLTADNEDQYMVELDNPENFCTGVASTISGSAPEGIEISSASMNYWINSDSSPRNLYANANNVEYKNDFSFPVSFSGGSTTLDSAQNEFVGNFNAFMWLEDDIGRDYSVQFSCYYDSSL